MNWEGEKECISREALKQLQLERLQATVLRVYLNVVSQEQKDRHSHRGQAVLQLRRFLEGVLQGEG